MELRERSYSRAVETGASSTFTEKVRSLKRMKRVQVSKSHGVGTLNGKFFKYQNEEKSKG